MRVEYSLSIKDSTRLEAILGGVREALVSGLIAMRACYLAVEYMIPLTLEPLVMTFRVLSRMGSAGWSASRASRIESVFLPLSTSKS